MDNELATLDVASIDSFEAQVASLILQYGNDSENITLYQSILGSYKYKGLLKLHNGKSVGWKHYCEVNKLRDRAKNGSERLAYYIPSRHYLEDLLLKHKRDLPNFLTEATEYIKNTFYSEEGNMQGSRHEKKNVFLPRLPLNPSSEEKAIEKLRSDALAKVQAVASSELDDGIASAISRQTQAANEVTLNDVNSVFSLSKLLMQHTQGGQLSGEIWEFISNIAGLSTSMVDNKNLEHLEIATLRKFLNDFHQNVAPKIIVEDLKIQPIDNMVIDNEIDKLETITETSVIEAITVGVTPNMTIENVIKKEKQAKAIKATDNKITKLVMAGLH